MQIGVSQSPALGNDKEEENTVETRLWRVSGLAQLLKVQGDESQKEVICCIFFFIPKKQ